MAAALPRMVSLDGSHGHTTVHPQELAERELKTIKQEGEYSELLDKDQVQRPLRPLLAAVLTEIYLCNACCRQEILRRSGRGQDAAEKEEALRAMLATAMAFEPPVSGRAGRQAGSPGVGVRVRVVIRGSQQRKLVGESQPVLMMSNPMIFVRTRSKPRSRCAS
jgi:hypothetical protein